MKEINLKEALAQASEPEAVEIIQQTLRQCVPLAFLDFMEEEVKELCAPQTPSRREGCLTGG